MSEKKTNGNWFKRQLDDSVVLAVFGAVAVILGVIWTATQIVNYYFLDKDTANEERGIEILADYYSLTKVNDSEKPILIVYGIEEGKNSLFVNFPFYISPKNVLKSESDILVYFKYKKPLKIVPTNHFYFNNIISQKLERNINDKNNNQEVSYALKTLNPNLILGIPEGVVLPPRRNQEIIKFNFGVSARNSKLEKFEAILNYHYSSRIRELVKLQLEYLKKSIIPELRQDLDIYFVIPKEYKQKYDQNGDVISSIASKEDQKLILGKYSYHKKEIRIFDTQGVENEIIK